MTGHQKEPQTAANCRLQAQSTSVLEAQRDVLLTAQLQALMHAFDDLTKQLQGNLG